MRKSVFILLICATVLLVFSAPVSAASKARPFHGYLVGQVWFTPDEASPSPSGLWSDSSGCGDVSHMGATIMTGRHPTPISDEIDDGNGTWAAANGDEVTFAYSGTAPFPVIGTPSTIVASTTFVITGGTGRFADATGGGTMIGYVSFPGELTLGPWPVIWAWHGTISY